MVLVHSSRGPKRKTVLVVEGTWALWALETSTGDLSAPRGSSAAGVELSAIRVPYSYPQATGAFYREDAKPQGCFGRVGAPGKRGEPGAPPDGQLPPPACGKRS